MQIRARVRIRLEHNYMATGPIGVRVSNEVRVRFMGRLRLELCFNLTLTLIYIIKTK